MRPPLERPQMKNMFVAAVLLLAACGTSAESAAPADNGPLTLRLGYFPNLTHAPALAGVSKRSFATAPGSGGTLETHTFNAGPEAVTATLAGAIDPPFVGPNPPVTASAHAHGQ